MSIVWQKNDIPSRFLNITIHMNRYIYYLLIYNSLSTTQTDSGLFDQKKERVLILFCRFNVIVECIQLICFENVIAECIQLIWFGNEGTSENLIMWSPWNVNDNSMLLAQSHSLKNQKTTLENDYSSTSKEMSLGK